MMNKQEASTLLHRIVAVIIESSIISCVSLDHDNAQVSKDPDNVGYLIKIKCYLNSYTMKCLKPVLEKHNLVMKEENGSVIISKL